MSELATAIAIELAKETVRYGRAYLRWKQTPYRRSFILGAYNPSPMPTFGWDEFRLNQVAAAEELLKKNGISLESIA